ncbi:hypothetical protein [Methylobacterium radiodurans]|uniref:hypothetical protein n=1 Tax=Methylobacterium radiodurans TaxID=2202828 RepID=UPI0013A56A85|nr:hypothetical protein [Methylobacterium radiodurans]
MAGRERNAVEKTSDFLGMTFETLIRVNRYHTPGFQLAAADNITRKPQAAKRSTA